MLFAIIFFKKNCFFIFYEYYIQNNNLIIYFIFCNLWLQEEIDIRDIIPFQKI